MQSDVPEMTKQFKMQPLLAKKTCSIPVCLENPVAHQTNEVYYVRLVSLARHNETFVAREKAAFYRKVPGFTQKRKSFFENSDWYGREIF